MSAQPVTTGKSVAKPASMLGDLGPRLLSGLVMVALSLAALQAGGFMFVAFWLVAAVAVHWEWQRMTGGPHEQIRMAGGGAVIALVAGLAALGSRDAAVVMLLGGVLATLLFVSSPTRMWNAAGILYAGSLVLAVVVLRMSIFNGYEAILWLFAIVWGTDIMAYFGGRLIGGPKLWPRVSPSKTWAGFLVGITSGSLLGLVALWAMSAPLSIGPVLLLGLATGAIAQGGDLFESSMKRRYGCKDSSRLIPGHGGVMDRLDGFIAAAVFAAILGGLRAGVVAPGNGLFVW
ncbi:MAG: phosphatidate cytidylyltransferase [Hyphomicrobiales bacterium]|nr:phosphatidate cytidylyltransferase [Hyphomicrobiales bacterium]